MKVLFLTKRVDHVYNNNPLITVVTEEFTIAASIWIYDCKTSSHKYKELDDKHHRNWTVAAWDIETQTEFPCKEGLLLSAFCINGEDVLVIDNTCLTNQEVLLDNMGNFLGVQHNADFEARWGVATGFLPDRMVCTLVNDRRLMSGLDGYRFDLVSVINRRLGHGNRPPFMDKDIRSQFATCTFFTDEQILYNAADTVKLKDVYYKQLELAEQLGMSFLLKTINSRIIIPIAKAEMAGTKHDSSKWIAIAKDREEKAIKLCQELTEIVLNLGVNLEEVNPLLKKQRLSLNKKSEKKDQRIVKLQEQLRKLEQADKTHLKSYKITLETLDKLTVTTQELVQGDTGTINWGSSKQVLEVLKQIGCPLPSAKDKKAKGMKDGLGKEARINWLVSNPDSSFEPIMKMFDKFKKIQHNIKSFGEKWIEQYVRDGRAYTSLDQAGTNSGRFSSGSKGPNKRYYNSQQIPVRGDDKVYRECFVADEGRLIGTLDYSNCEGSVMTAQSGDLNMQKILQLKDSHSYLGTKCWRNIYKHRGDEVLAETYEMNKSTVEKEKERDVFKNSGGLFPVAKLIIFHEILVW